MAVEKTEINVNSRIEEWNTKELDARIAPNDRGKNASFCRYVAKMVQLGLEISSNKPKYSPLATFERTRNFEVLVREQLVTSKFEKPEDYANVSENIQKEICDRLDAFKGAMNGERQGDIYLSFALCILEKEGAALRNLLQSVFEGVTSDLLVNELNDDDCRCIRFVAFYALSTYLRRNGEKDTLKVLHNKYLPRPEKNWDKEEGFWAFSSAKHIYLESIDHDELEPEHIEKAWNLCKRGGEMEEHAGVQMMYAQMVYDLCEKNAGWAREDGKKHLKQALAVINDAINDSERYYPKTHIIKGQILSYQGKYKKARDSIREGIKLQRSRKKENDDYVERLMEFYVAQFAAEIKEQEERIREENQKLEDITQDIKNRDIKSVEILAMFSAVIGIFVSQLDSGSADVAFILTLFGVIIISFTTFHCLLNAGQFVRKQKKWQLNILVEFLLIVLAYSIGAMLIIVPRLSFTSELLRCISNWLSGLLWRGNVCL